MQLPWGPPLDPATFMFAIAVFGFLMAGLSFASARALGRDTAALVDWGRSMACAGGAFLLYFLRGDAPAFATFVVANALVMGVACYALRAHARVLGRPDPRPTVLGAAVLGMSGVLATHALDLSREVAAFTLSVALSAVLLRMAALIGRYADWRATPSGRVAIGSTLVLAAFLLARAALIVLRPDDAIASPSSGKAHAMVMVIATLFVVASSVGFILMVHDRQRRAALESARHDGMTGLLTRTAFFEAADRIARDDPRPFSVVMVDIDRFKLVNDVHGHAVGDLVIEHAAALIARSIRGDDLAARYGGEEFCVLLRNCDQLRAQVFCERLVAAAAGQRVSLARGGSVEYTLSAGFAWSSDDGGAESAGRLAELAELVERADRALYAAKTAGRNRALAG